MGWQPVSVTRRAAAFLLTVALLGGCSTGGHLVPPGQVRAGHAPLSGTPAPATSAPATPLVYTWPVPNSALTPGVVVPGCTYPRPAADRNVSTATKHAAAVAYHYTGRAGIAYVEYDHRVPYWACGADTLPNIWPEPVEHGYHETAFWHNRKDELETLLAVKVRYRKMTLAEAQAVFLGDWRVGWCQYVKHPTGFC